MACRSGRDGMQDLCRTGLAAGHSERPLRSRYLPPDAFRLLMGKAQCSCAPPDHAAGRISPTQASSLPRR